MAGLARFCIVFAVLASLAAATLLAVNAYLSRASVWSPLSLTLPKEAGEAVSGQFISGLDGIFELEIELPLEEPLGPDVSVPELTAGSGKIAIDWAVLAADTQIARGDAATPLYWERRAQAFRSRLNALIYASPLSTDRSLTNLFGLLGKPSVVSGIGRFATDQGREYVVEARTLSLGPAAVASEPILRVRARRQIWRKARAQTVVYAHAAKYVLAVALLSLCAGLALVALRRRRHA